MRFPTQAVPANPAAPVTVTAGELAGWAFDTGLAAHYLAHTATVGAGARRAVVEVLARLTVRFTDLAAPPGPAATTETAP